MEKRAQGTGTIMPQGHVRCSKGEIRKFEHVLIAEKALRRELRGEEEVHHADGDKANNANSNLVICPDRAYHMLLHARMRAKAACGNPDWRKCWICQQHDDLANLRTYRMKRVQYQHQTCINAYVLKTRHAREARQCQS